MTTKIEEVNKLCRKYSVIKLTIKEDPILMRVSIETEKKPSQEFKQEIKKLYSNYSLNWAVR